MEYARTNWRAVIATLAMGGAVSLSLLLGFTTRSTTKRVERTVIRSGPPCVRLANGLPSQGCERLARLLADTCVARPDLCEGVIRRAIQSAPAPTRRQLARAVKRALATPPGSAGAGGRKPKQGGGGGGSQGGGSAPGGSGGAGATPAPGGTQPGGGSSGGGSSGGSGSPARPSPSDVANNAARRATDTANDATGAVGAGRPVPQPPEVPAVPPVPDLPIPQVPCIEMPPVTHCAS